MDAESPDKPRPLDCLMVCPACSLDGGARVVRFRPDDSEVRCPDCHRPYRVMTRQLAAATQQYPAGTQARYRIFTREGSRTVLRPFSGPPAMKLLIGEWVTLVRHRGRLIGVANQSSQLWYPVPARRDTSPYTRAAQAGLAVAAVYSLFLIPASLGLAGHAWRSSGVVMIAVTALIAAVLAMPMVRGEKPTRSRDRT